MREAFKACLVSLIIAVAMVVVLEGTVRLFWPQNVHTTYLSGGTLGERDPVLGHTNNPGAHARVRAPEFDVEYVIGPKGFRAAPGRDAPEGDAPDREAATHEAASAARDGETRILLLGDSFTFGASNAYEDIWPVHIARRFAKAGTPVRIINAGVPGYNTAQQAMYLERLYDEHRPDIVVLGFLANDLFANQPISRDATAPVVADAAAVVARGGGKKSGLHSVMLFKRLLMQSDWLYVRLYLMTPRKAFFETPVPDFPRERIAVTRTILERMQAFLEERGAKLVVVSIPQLFQILLAADERSEPGLNPAMPDDALSPFAEKGNVTWVRTLGRLAQEYRRGAKDLYHRFDGHLNARGNAVLADIVYDALAPLAEAGSNEVESVVGRPVAPDASSQPAAARG